MFTGPNTITNGLILSLDAANVKSYVNGSTTWRDLSGNGNNATLINGPTFNSANLGSIVFDGVDDYVSCGNIMPSTAYTKCVFFNISNLAAPNNLISGGNLGTHYFYPANSQYLRAGHFQGGELVSDTPILVNTWYHGVVTFSTTLGFSMYQNGINVGNYNNTSTFIGGNIVYIGTYLLSGTGYYLNGTVASAQIYNRALSPAEVLQNYNAQKSRYNPE
jgi:hypothetical protein